MLKTHYYVLLRVHKYLKSLPHTGRVLNPFRNPQRPLTYKYTRMSVIERILLVVINNLSIRLTHRKTPNEPRQRHKRTQHFLIPLPKPNFLTSTFTKGRRRIKLSPSLFKTGKSLRPTSTQHPRPPYSTEDLDLPTTPHLVPSYTE